jgi:hypothetical protein
MKILSVDKQELSCFISSNSGVLKISDVADLAERNIGELKDLKLKKLQNSIVKKLREAEKLAKRLEDIYNSTVDYDKVRNGY